MQIKHIGFRVCGFYTVASFATKEQHMNVAIQQQRHALVFWKNHGLKVAMDHANASRSTSTPDLPSVRAIAKLITDAKDKSDGLPGYITQGNKLVKDKFDNWEQLEI